jgi:hypothetical protein
MYKFYDYTTRDGNVHRQTIEASDAAHAQRILRRCYWAEQIRSGKVLFIAQTVKPQMRWV